MKGAIRSVAAIAIAVLIVLAAAPYWTAAMLITRAAGAPGWLLPIAEWSAREVSEAIEQVPLRTGATRARVFRPAGPPRRAALLVSGVHAEGIDEPRLVSLARDLAGTGIVVVTPEIHDLMAYRVTSQVTDTIEDVAYWMSARDDLSGSNDIGLIGVSFSGGLAIVAAGRPSIRERIAFVLSFGGHGNLPRVLRYLCTGEGAPPDPHDYGLAVVLHQAADQAVPAEQVDGLRDAIETFLTASALTRTDPAKAEQLFEAARARAGALPQPSATLMQYVNNRNVEALGARLLPYVDRLGRDPALSPDQSPAPAAPVFLLHGSEDNVIPAMESVMLARHLRDETEVHLLLSSVLTHVDVAARPSLKDSWDMVVFWKRILERF